MTTQRERRLAENESLFRAANERIAAWPSRARADATEIYFCECADPECDRKIELRVSEYERVRDSFDRFFVVPGHEIPDVEKVLEAHDTWVLIEKNPGVEEVLEETDPRLDGA